MFKYSYDRLKFLFSEECKVSKSKQAISSTDAYLILDLEARSCLEIDRELQVPKQTKSGL